LLTTTVVRRLLTVGAAAAMIATPYLANTPAANAAGGAITVSPRPTALALNTTYQIKVGATASSFPPGQAVIIAYCNPTVATASGAGGCDLRSGHFATSTAKPDGSVAPKTIPIRSGNLGGDPAANCPPSDAQIASGGHCAVAISDSSPTGVNYSALVYFTQTSTVAPASGKAGTAITLSGSKMQPGETVTNNWSTGLSSPTKLKICSAVVAANGTWTCSGKVPTANRGAKGVHKIIGKGSVSANKSKGSFNLTS
jgi:hypothetical protein